MFRVEQREFKTALLDAIDAYEAKANLDLFVASFEAAIEEHDHYLNVNSVRQTLVKLLGVYNLKRARLFVSHIPDVTASRFVVGFQLLLALVVTLGVLAIVIGLAVFLWQHFF